MSATDNQLPHQGRRVLISAGAGGIGHAIASLFHRQGATVCIADVDGAGVARCREQFPGMLCHTADVSCYDEVARLCGSCYGAWGGIDALVNNVGIAGPTAALEDVTPEDWERTLRVNVNSHFYCCKAVTPAMKAAGGGSIVHISSTAGFTGFPLRAPYTVSKWAVIGLARTLAMELGEFGIRVNAVCPGSVRGPRIERVIAAEAAAGGRPPEYVRDCYERQVSMRTFVDAVDVAETVSFLCSERAARISGQVLSVDGNTESLRTPVPAPGDAR